MAEGKFPNIENYLRVWSERLIKALRNSAVKEMQENKSKAKFPPFGDPQASPLVAGIRTQMSILGTTVEAHVIAPQEWYWLEHGRAPGKMPPEQPIIKWMVHRGIEAEIDPLHLSALNRLRNKVVKKGLKQYSMEKKRKQLAFLIRRKIGKDGTRATNFFSNVVTEKLLNDLKITIKEQFKKDIRIDLLTLAS